jgi:hypothetical protein
LSPDSLRWWLGFFYRSDSRSRLMLAHSPRRAGRQVLFDDREYRAGNTLDFFIAHLCSPS